MSYHKDDDILDKVRYILKKRDLKASKTKISISWTLDVNEMRGDKIDVRQYFFGKKKYIEEIENIFKTYLNPNQEIVSSEELNT